MAIVELTKENFQPGMGIPFAMFTDKSLLVSETENLFDNRLELEGSLMVNLEDRGMMFGMNADYSPIEDWNLELEVMQFWGDKNNGGNPFTKLEDYSHIRLGFKYSF